jgi:hypothetical protein
LSFDISRRGPVVHAIGEHFGMKSRNPKGKAVKPRQTRREREWSLIVKEASEIENLLGNCFRAHWKAVYAELQAGVDVAKKRASRFLAGQSSKRLQLAKRYYTRARAKRFAASSTEEAIQICYAWFSLFQVAVIRNEDDHSEIRKHLDVLVRSEYIALTWPLIANVWFETASLDSTSPECIDEFQGCDPPSVFPLPDPDGEGDDVFEEIVSSYCGERLSVCKSTSDPFLASERVEAMNEIERLFLESASYEGDDPEDWSVRFLSEPSAALIKAHIFGEVGSPEYEEYTQELDWELSLNGDEYVKRQRGGAPGPVPCEDTDDG